MAETWIEDACTVTHNGRDYTAGGAYITPERAIGYVRATAERVGQDVMIDAWHGQTIGYGRIVARWRVQSWFGSHMCQIEATINGITYTGRGFGNGMIWQGKAKANGRKAA